ncbi:MAG: AtpZ/AtpI family protein [Candidatus Amoebophilus sp.]
MLPKNNNKLLHNYLQYASLGIQMVIVMGVFTWIGLRLDKYMELRFPIFLCLFSVGSTVLTMYITIKKLLWHISKHKEKVEQEK